MRGVILLIWLSCMITYLLTSQLFPTGYHWHAEHSFAPAQRELALTTRLH